MIVYSLVRRLVPERHAAVVVALVYALIVFLTFCSLSQIGADLRYANI
jgi:hypothetical protein